MKKMKLLVFLLCFITRARTQSVTAADSTRKADELLKLEQALCDALPGDTLLWSRVLDPKWYDVTEDGTGVNKTDFLKEFAPFSKGLSGNIRVVHPVCQFYDNIAVVHYVADEHETVYGQNLHTTYAAMDTWYQKNGSWIMLSSQIFEVPQLPPPVHTDPSVWKPYTGTYELTAGKTARVTADHDTLFIQKNNRPVQPLFPETDQVFFVQTDARGRKIFLRDASGNEVMIERRNGQDLIWKKISKP